VDQHPSEALRWTHQADHPRLTDDLPLYTFWHDYNHVAAQHNDIYQSINQSQYTASRVMSKSEATMAQAWHSHLLQSMQADTTGSSLVFHYN